MGHLSQRQELYSNYPAMTWVALAVLARFTVRSRTKDRIDDLGEFQALASSHHPRLKNLNSYERLYFEKRAPGCPAYQGHLWKCFPTFSHPEIQRPQLLWCKGSQLLLRLVADTDFICAVIVLQACRMQEWLGSGSLTTRFQKRHEKPGDVVWRVTVPPRIPQEEAETVKPKLWRGSQILEVLGTWKLLEKPAGSEKI